MITGTYIFSETNSYPLIEFTLILCCLNFEAISRANVVSDGALATESLDLNRPK